MAMTEPETAPSTVGRFYRPELDALRFLAFLMVFVHHAFRNASLRSVVGIHTMTGALAVAAKAEQLADEVGNFGMSLFFLLSAFLITELMLLERGRTGGLNVRAFYARRALRIWPLYFAFLAFNFFLGQVNPHDYHVTGKQLLAFLLLSGNWYNLHYGFFPATLGVLWSISVEEQFYLAWPAFFRIGHGVPGVRAGIVVFTLAGLATIVWLGHSSTNEEVFWGNSLVQFLFFALGGALALHIHKHGVPRSNYAIRIALAAAAFTVWAVSESLLGMRNGATTLHAWSALLGYAAIATGTAMLFLSILGLRPGLVPNWLRTLGKVSYGLYVFHMLCLVEAARQVGLLAHHIHAHGALLVAMKISVPILALGAAIAMALLSYQWFESAFLRMRTKFTVVPSRPI